MFTTRRKKNDCGDFAYVFSKWLLVEYARHGDLDEVERLVVDCGADPNIQDAFGDTPLHYAAYNGRLGVVRLLLEHGADPNVQDHDDRTPLHFAVGFCFVDVVRVLLEHGADPTIRDNEGMTPLDYGSDCGEFIKELRRRSGETRVYE